MPARIAGAYSREARRLYETAGTDSENREEWNDGAVGRYPEDWQRGSQHDDEFGEMDGSFEYKWGYIYMSQTREDGQDEDGQGEERPKAIRITVRWMMRWMRNLSISEDEVAELIYE